MSVGAPEVPPLKVAVPASAAGLPASGGAGKVWQRALAGLTAVNELRVIEDPARLPWGWRPDVWLSDGHRGPLPVDEPVVTVLHEAAWADPVVRPLLEPWFIEAAEQPSADAARQATIVITPSAFSRDQIVETSGVSPTTVHVVPNGVDPVLFRPARTRPRALLAAAGYEPERPYVVYVSVIHPRKNYAALKTAMGGLAARGLPHGLVLVGAAAPDQRDPRPLEADAAADLPGAPGRVVRLTGLSEEDVADVLSAAAAFCLPSLMEGFGLTALEAMACGVPVVVSDRGALPEVVGDAAVIVEPTAAAVEDALARLLSAGTEARALRDAGRRRALGMGWSITVRGFQQAISAAAGRPTGSSVRSAP